MEKYYIKMRADGSIMIPEAAREAWNITEGEELVLFNDEDGFYIMTLKHVISRAQDLISDFNPDIMPQEKID